MPHPDPARTMNGLGTVGRNIARDAVLVFCAALIARALTIGIIGQGTFPSPEFDDLVDRVFLELLGFQMIAVGLIGELIIFTHAKELKEYTIDEIIE